MSDSLRGASQPLNLRLIELRRHHNWTQEDVARAVEVRVKTYCRWERDTRPSNKHMEALLRHFQVTEPTDLGFSAKATRQRTHASSPPPVVSASALPDAPSQGAAPSAAAPFQPDAISHADASGLLSPPVIPHMKFWVRQSEFQVCKRLLRQAGSPRVAIAGLPGAGKTLLATVLAHDPRIRKRYPDGVIWIGLGPTPPLSARLRTVLLGVCSRQGREYTFDVTQADLGRMRWRLQNLIGERRILFIIDDVWDAEAARLFSVGGIHCGYLITTRQPSLAVDYTNDRTRCMTLAEFDEDQSFQLLRERLRADEAGERLPDPLLRSLARMSGGLPLALMLITHRVAMHVNTGNFQRLNQLLSTLDAPAILSQCHDLQIAKRYSEADSEVPRSLHQSINLSVVTLPPEAQATVRALALFPAKPGSFSQEAALAVSAAPAEVLDALINQGLVDIVGDGRYAIHQSIVDYLRCTNALVGTPEYAPIRQARARMLAYYFERDAPWGSPKASAAAELDNAIAALSYAAEEQGDASFVRGTTALSEALATSLLYEAADDLLPRAIARARRLGDAHRLANLLRWWGYVDEMRGRPEAREHYRAALHAARQANDLPLRMKILEGLIQCDVNLGAYARAWRVAVQGLRVALGNDAPQAVSRFLANNEDETSLLMSRLAELGNDATHLIPSLLIRMGDVAASQGYTIAEVQFYRAALPVARASQDRQCVCYLLQYLGAAMTRRGLYDLAERYYTEGYKHACRLRQPSPISAMLLGLGVVAQGRGDYAQARDYYTRSLDLALRHDLALRIGQATVNLGALETQCQNYARARDYFRTSMEIAERTANHWHHAEVHLEQGVCALRQHCYADAERDFTRVLDIAAAAERELAARARFGLAQIYAARGERPRALAMVNECLTEMRSIQHSLCDAVALWRDSVVR